MERGKVTSFALCFALGVGVLDAVAPTRELLATDDRTGLTGELAAFLAASIGVAIAHLGLLALVVFGVARVLGRAGLPSWSSGRGLVVLALVTFSWAAFLGVEIYDAAYEPDRGEAGAMLLRGTALILLAAIAAAAGRLPLPVRRIGAALVAAFCLGAALFVSGDSRRGESPPKAASLPPNIVLYVIDTLRADALGAYGYSRATSPAFDRIAEEGVVFERAYVQYTASTASHTTIQTGCYPARHGAVANGMSIPGSIRSLASRLRDEGYATAAFHNHSLLSQYHGFERGFDVFVETHEPVLAGTPFRLWLHELHFVRAWHVLFQFQTVMPLAEAWISTVRQPFFLWVTTLQPHRPYIPPRALVSALEAEPYEGDLTGRVRNDLGAKDVTEADVAHIRTLYDAEVRWADMDLASLYDRLGETGLRDRTLLVVTSDHGEAMGEHGIYFDHGDLFEESVHVPLLLAGAGLPKGRRVTEAVGLVELAATLLSQAKGAPGLSICDGSDLGDLWSEAPAPRAPVLAWKHGQIAAIDERHKLVLESYPDGPGRFYDLARDPGEQHPLTAETHPEAARLLERIRSYCETSPRETEYCALDQRILRGETGAETRRRLRALGYVE